MQRKVEKRERARQMKYRKDRESARSSCSTLMDADLDSLRSNRQNEMKSSMTTTTTVAAGHHQYQGIQEEVKEEDFDYIIEAVDDYLASIR